LDFGFVSAQSEAAAGVILRQSLAKTQKSSLQTAILFLETLFWRDRARTVPAEPVIFIAPIKD
jgi:hypothetical protein